jgi:hypothetical protein
MKQKHKNESKSFDSKQEEKQFEGWIYGGISINYSLTTQRRGRRAFGASD